MSGLLAVPDLETPRLRLRHWVEADAEALHAAYGDAATMRFWDSLPRREVLETEDMIRGSRSVDPEYHAAFAVTLRATGQPVGMVNYHDRRSANRRSGGSRSHPGSVRGSCKRRCRRC